MGEPVSRRVRSRLELPEADFVALKAHAVLTRTTLGRLIEDAIAAWLDRDEPPPPPAPLGERVARYTVSLPDDLHTRLKVRAVYARMTMQALMRAALVPTLAAAGEPVRNHLAQRCRP
ncbi:MAG: hypothetical protein IT340_23780 [Chloroflexi bacterium]|nr:hypothetical protein [Chloroflexota bacterium]